MTIQKAPITIGIIVTSMFHSFFQFPSKVKVLILLFTFFQFYSVVSRDNKVNNFASSFFFFFSFFFVFLLIIIRSGRLAKIRWSVCMLKSHWSLYVSFFKTDTGLCISLLLLLVVVVVVVVVQRYFSDWNRIQCNLALT